MHFFDVINVYGGGLLAIAGVLSVPVLVLSGDATVEGTAKTLVASAVFASWAWYCYRHPLKERRSGDNEDNED